MEQKILERAKEFFGNNQGVDKVYFTSDGNLFRAAIYADNWKQSLTDKKVTAVTRSEAMGVPADVDTDQSGGQADEHSKAGSGDEGAGEGSGSSEGQGGEGDGSGESTEGKKEATPDDDKAAINRRYIELFDKKPVAMKLVEIKAKIAAKEAELSK